MSRRSVLILGVTLVLAVFAVRACGTRAGPAADEPGTDASSSAPAAEPGDPTPHPGSPLPDWSSRT